MVVRPSCGLSTEGKQRHSKTEGDEIGSKCVELQLDSEIAGVRVGPECEDLQVEPEILGVQCGSENEEPHIELEGAEVQVRYDNEGVETNPGIAHVKMISGIEGVQLRCQQERRMINSDMDTEQVRSEQGSGHWQSLLAHRGAWVGVLSRLSPTDGMRLGEPTCTCTSVKEADGGDSLSVVLMRDGIPGKEWQVTRPETPHEAVRPGLAVWVAGAGGVGGMCVGLTTYMSEKSFIVSFPVGLSPWSCCFMCRRGRKYFSWSGSTIVGKKFVASLPSSIAFRCLTLLVTRLCIDQLLN